MQIKKELPLVEPVYSTYHNGIFSACISENPTIRNYYLNEVMILTCTSKFRSGYTTPEITIEGTSMDQISYLDKQWVWMRFVKGQISYVIRNMIDEGYYAYFWGIDDYYMKGKSWYRKRHFNHNGTICGYNQEDKTYCIYAYDSNWVYRKFWTSQKCFDMGRKAMFKKGVHGFVCGIKPKMEKIDFSAQKALKKIQEYLDPNITGLHENQEGEIRGIIVHEYIAEYISKLYDGSIPYEKMDWRIFRVIWEHKKIMLERIKCIERELNMNMEISNDYEHLVEEANSIRMMYALHHKKRRDSILPGIQKRLIVLKEREGQLLNQLLDKSEFLI